MTLLSNPVDGVGAIAAGARAGQIVAINDAGALALAANVPIGGNGGHFGRWENGGAGPAGAGLNEWFSSVGTRTPLTTEAGWFNDSASIETGTTTTGVFSIGGNSGIQFSSTSGTWVYEKTFITPVLSDGTNTCSDQCGFAVGNPATSGAVLRYTHSVNGGKYQYVTAAGGVSTAMDSGIALVAGNAYHVRIEMLNDQLATFYLITTFAGSTWSDTGVWVNPTTISTNIPSGSGQMVGSGTTLQKSAGTTSFKQKIGYQWDERIPPFTRVEPTRFIADGMLSGGDGVGQALGAPFTALGVNSSGLPSWSLPCLIKPPIVFHAYGRGGFQGPNAHDFGLTFGGSAGVGAAGVQAIDNSLFGTTALLSNFVADGWAAFQTAIAIKLDATVNPLLFEGVLSSEVLSTGGAPFNGRAGYLDSISVAPSNGIFVELDSNANAAITCKARAGGVTTTTSTGITIVADTYYFVRHVSTATAISFYVQANDATAPTPIVITTNIPTGVAMAAAIQVRSTGAVGLTRLRYGYALAESRSTT